MKVTDDVKNVRRVHVELSGSEVRRLICEEVADRLNADIDAVVEHLRVDLSDGASATTYVRGELPMTRDQLLESLGLTPTEPVETDGAAVAESLGDHETGTSDVVETPETVAAFEALAANVDHCSIQDAFDKVTKLLEQMRSLPATVEGLVDLRRTAQDSLDRDPQSGSGRRLLKIVEAIEGDAGLRHQQRSGGLPEDREPQRLVPRLVSEDSLRQARLKLVELANSPRRPEGRATATDLHYVLALLGGEL